MGDAFFIFDGKSSRDYGLRILNDVTLEAPERDIEFVQVYGKHGELAFDNGRYKSLTKEFRCRLVTKNGKTLDNALSEISTWLCQNRGYKKLIFSGESDYYYRAMYYEALPIKEILRVYGEVKIRFKCEPMRRLLIGDTPILIKKGQAIHNAFKEDSLPLIRIEGRGNITLNIGKHQLVLKGLTEGIEIDCELEQAVWKGKNMSHLVFSYPFPKLEAFTQSAINWEGNISKLEIIPRWWF